METTNQTNEEPARSEPAKRTGRTAALLRWLEFEAMKQTYTKVKGVGIGVRLQRLTDKLLKEAKPDREHTRSNH